MTYARHLVIIVAAYSGGLLQGQQALTGNIVAGDSGSAIQGAQVVAVRSEAASRGRFTPVVRETSSARDGSFSFKDLPAGSYRVCVRDAGAYLNPCWWPKYSPPATIVLDGRQDATLRLALTPGIRMYVRFNGTDESLLSGIRDASSDVIVKAIDSGDPTVAFTLEISTRTKLQVDYTALIPAAPSIRLSVGSAKLALADAGGVELRATENSFAIPPARKGIGVPGSRVRLNINPVIVLNVQRRLL